MSNFDQIRELIKDCTFKFTLQKGEDKLTISLFADEIDEDTGEIVKAQIEAQAKATKEKSIPVKPETAKKESEKGALPDKIIIEVEAGRLAVGGDIRESYSGDVIASSSKVRKPFKHRGRLYICVLLLYSPDDSTESNAFEIVPIDEYTKETHEYADKKHTYEGMIVSHRGRKVVMTNELRFRGNKPPDHSKLAETIKEEPKKEAPTVGFDDEFDDEEW